MTWVVIFAHFASLPVVISSSITYTWDKSISGSDEYHKCRYQSLLLEFIALSAVSAPQLGPLQR